jgi:hypothetical protein
MLWEGTLPRQALLPGAPVSFPDFCFLILSAALSMSRRGAPHRLFHLGFVNVLHVFATGGGRTKPANRGVTWDKSKNMWRVRLCLPGGGREHIGCAPDPPPFPRNRTHRERCLFLLSPSTTLVFPLSACTVSGFLALYLAPDSKTCTRRAAR